MRWWIGRLYSPWFWVGVAVGVFAFGLWAVH
jgi:hypothetical protein